MDVAASEFYKDGKYDLDFKNPETTEENWLSSDQLLEMYKVCGEIKILSLIIVIPSSLRDSWLTTLSYPLRIHLTRMTGRPTPSLLKRRTFR